MENFATALYQYAVIIDNIAHEYEADASVKDIRKDHPELNFLDKDEIEEMLAQANLWRKKSPDEQIRLLNAMKAPRKPTRRP